MMTSPLCLECGASSGSGLTRENSVAGSVHAERGAVDERGVENERGPDEEEDESAPILLGIQDELMRQEMAGARGGIVKHGLLSPAMYSRKYVRVPPGAPHHCLRPPPLFRPETTPLPPVAANCCR